MSIFNYKKIKDGNSVYIIAEIGVNHDCSLQKAKKMILLAKKNGANAAKFQTYKADTIVSKDSPAYWDTKKEKTKTQYELFTKFDKFNEKEYVSLAQYCKKIKIDFLSTPFDVISVNFLKKLVPVFKISSSDITNYELLEAVAKTKKPVILSTGASNLGEINSAIKVLRISGCKKIIILHCILSYPTRDVNANLNMIKGLKEHFPNYIIGYSDHTLPDKNMVNLTTAFLLGAKVIEKHFTLNKNQKGNDHYHAMNSKDLKLFKSNLDRIKLILGKDNSKKVVACEKKSRRFARRSLVLKNNLKKGQKIKKKDLISLRPVKGIPSENWKIVLGKKINKNKKIGNHLLFSDVVGLKKNKNIK